MFSKGRRFVLEMNQIWAKEFISVLAVCFTYTQIRNDSDGEGESDDPEKKKLQNQLQGSLPWSS